MNVENIKQVIEVIKAEDTYFSMEAYGVPVDGNADCCTASCICGWANVLANPTQDALNYFEISDKKTAAEWLGIDDDRAWDLFLANGLPLEWISRNDAIITLEKLIETGEVDWSHCETYEEVDWDGDNLV